MVLTLLNHLLLWLFGTRLDESESALRSEQPAKGEAACFTFHIFCDCQFV